MNSETVAILGIPIDNLTMDETVARIFSMIEDYRQDRRPRQVATVNVDFVVNTLTWQLGRIRHPELLDILQRADLVTADGMPVVVISRLLGSPLKGRVTGADLVPRLAKKAVQRGKSLFFLGGREVIARRAATVLQEQYEERGWECLDQVRSELEAGRKLPPFYTILTHNPDYALLDLFGSLDVQ